MTIDYVVCCVCNKYEITGHKEMERRIFEEMPEAVRLVLDTSNVSHGYCMPCYQNKRLKLKQILNKP